MSDEIRVFEHSDFGSIRMFEEDGEVVAVADDFAKTLGYSDATHMLRSLDPDEFHLHTVEGKRGQREAHVVTEAGMYHAILIRKAACVKDPTARETVVGVQRWVTHEVLPSIRRTGGYVNPLGPQMGDEEGMAILSKAVVFAERKLAALAAENEGMRPMAALGEAVSAASTCIEVGALGRILRQNGCKWAGRGRLFKRLRDDGYLMGGGDRHNLPYQRWVEQGLFEVQEVPYRRADGVACVGLKPMVTQKGVAYFLRRYAHVEGLPGMEGEGES